MGKTVGADGVCVYSGFWWRLALPHVTIPAHAAIVAGTCAWAAGRTDDPLRDVCLGAAAGFAAWTAFEYAFHRWLLHHVRRPFLRRVFWEALHREHHGYRRMRDPDHHAIHAAISVPVVLAVVGAAAAASDGAFAPAVAAGWVVGYCAYEALHWFFHSRDAPVGLAARAPLRGLWEAHRAHHLERADRNYGFVTRLWDRALRTDHDPRAPRRGATEPPARACVRA